MSTPLPGGAMAVAKLSMRISIRGETRLRPRSSRLSGLLGFAGVQVLQDEFYEGRYELRNFFHRFRLAPSGPEAAPGSHVAEVGFYGHEIEFSRRDRRRQQDRPD